MKKCKIVHGKLRCEEDNDLAFVKANEGRSFNKPMRGLLQPPLKQTIPSKEISISPVKSDFDDLLDAHNIPEEHRDDVKDIFHPIIGNHITKANTQKVPKFVRTKALLAKASSVYFESGKNQQQVDSFLKKNGLTNYTVDYDLSTGDGLTVINNESGKASLVFRGTKPSNMNDWIENKNYALTDWRKHPLDTTYGKRIKEFHENASEIYDIDHIVGFSKGGYGAISLGDHINVETTTFSPAITLGHIRTSRNTKHNIWNTTEDVVSVLANPLKIKNRNVNVNTVNALEEFDSVLPWRTHDLKNYIKNDTRRSVSRADELTQNFVNSGKIQAELEHARVANDMIDLKMSYTDYVRQMNPNDVNTLDDTFSHRIQRNDLLHKTWKELGGQFTQNEAEHLTRAVESTYEPLTDRLQRSDFAQQPKNMQVKAQIEMQQAHEQLGKQIENIAQEHPFHKSQISASHIPRAGVTMLGGGIVGDSVGFILGEDSLLLDKIIPTTLMTPMKNVRDEIKPITDVIPEQIKKDAVPFTTAAIMASITGGSLAAEGAAGVATYEASKIIGEGAQNVAKLSGASEELQTHVNTISQGLSAPGLFLGALRGISTGLRAISAVELVTPIPGMRPLAALSLAGAGVAEGLNFMLQPSSTEEVVS